MSKKITTEEFIKRAKEVHGEKYDYSKVIYKDMNTPVCIICPEHGEFWQRPTNHLNGKGCKKCAGRGMLSMSDFLAKAHEKHGNKYDYSKVVYVNATTPVCIICPEHGEFWQSPYNHAKGNACPKCVGRGKTTDEFIVEVRGIHGDKYDYSKIVYTKNSVNVCVVCPEHGEFFVTPANLLKGKGCPKCAALKRGASQRLTNEDFIAKAHEVHGNKYDYSKVNYVNSHTDVCIICPEHGEFWQKPMVHLKGGGCPKCAGKNWTTEEFIAKAKEVHGDKYDYSKTIFKNMTKEVCIICPEHGEFWQKPNNHLAGAGCVRCSKPNRNLSNDEFLVKAHELHGDKYDYSKVKYVDMRTPVCIVCPEHGEFWQRPSDHLRNHGCPNCQGLRKEYKYNLLQEFASEYDFRAFLENNDVNILQVILRNVEPKYEPIRDDVIRAISHTEEEDPIAALGAKYQSDDENEEDTTINATTVEVQPSTSITTVDLDDDDAVINAISVEDTTETTRPEPTIEDVVKNTEHELEVITKIEHMLTPEDRKYIMDKFLNDKRRDWMTMREMNKVG